MSLTTRERGGLYTGGVYIRVEKCIPNLGGLYSGELIHGGGLFTEFYGSSTFSIVNRVGKKHSRLTFESSVKLWSFQNSKKLINCK